MPGPLLTPDAVVAAAGIEQLPQYRDVIRLSDAAGFSVNRDYPQGTRLASLRTPSGIKNYSVLIHFTLRPATSPVGIQRVHLAARLRGAWEEEHRFAFDPYDYTNADCPGPEAVHTARRASPLALEFSEDFYYDAAEGQFYAETGQVTAEMMLDFVYETHCRTLRRPFRLKWWFLSKGRAAIQKAVWNSHKAALWALEHGYDVVPKIDDRRHRPGAFHQYKMSEFERASDTSGTHFFGFRSSNRSLFTNIMLLGLACVLVFYYARHHPLTRAIYGNTALTTVALVFGFLLADQGAPFLLKVAVCLLARLKFRAFFVYRQVSGVYRKERPKTGGKI